MTITVNGEKKEFKENTDINDLLESLKLSGKPVVVELNKEIIPKEDYDRVLSDNDKIEIVTFVGGG